MKKKKLKLRGWVKVVLVILFYMFLLLSIVDIFEGYNDKAQKCDEIKGHMCSYYEIYKLNVGGE